MTRRTRKEKYSDFLQRVGVQRAGELTPQERGGDRTGPDWKHLIPYRVVDGAAKGGILPEAVTGLALKSKAWKHGARWDIPILQAVAWRNVENIRQGLNTGGLVHLGTPRDLAQSIRGCSPAEVDTEQAHQIEESLERLTSLKLSDIGWIDEGGPPSMAPGHLMTIAAKSGGAWVVQAGACLMPHELKDLIKSVNATTGRGSKLAAEFRDMIKILVPVQSQGFLLNSYMGSNRSIADQDRAYAMAHAITVDEWGKAPNANMGIRLKDRRINERIQDYARMSYDRWEPFVDHLVALGHYKETRAGVYIPQDPRAVHWLSKRRNRGASTADPLEGAQEAPADRTESARRTLALETSDQPGAVASFRRQRDQWCEDDPARMVGSYADRDAAFRSMLQAIVRG